VRSEQVRACQRRSTQTTRMPNTPHLARSRRTRPSLSRDQRQFKAIIVAILRNRLLMLTSKAKKYSQLAGLSGAVRLVTRTEPGDVPTRRVVLLLAFTKVTHFLHAAHAQELWRLCEKCWLLMVEALSGIRDGTLCLRKTKKMINSLW
jgi:hypothetical protein